MQTVQKMLIHHSIFFALAFILTRNIDDVIILSFPYFCLYYLIYLLAKAYKYFFLSDPHRKERKLLAYKPVKGSQRLFSDKADIKDFNQSDDNFISKNIKYTEMHYEFDDGAYFGLGENNIFLTNKPNLLEKLLSRWPYRVAELDDLPYLCVNFRIVELTDNKTRLELVHKSITTYSLNPKDYIVGTILEFENDEETIKVLQTKLRKKS